MESWSLEGMGCGIREHGYGYGCGCGGASEWHGFCISFHGFGRAWVDRIGDGGLKSFYENVFLMD